MAESLTGKRGYLEAPSDEEALEVLESIKKLKREQVPGDTTNWDQKYQDAKDLYNEGADRNAWLSLAQTVGQGLLRIGAANEGLARGVDLSHVDLGPGYDVEGANKRNLAEYKMDTDVLGNAAERARQMRKDEQEQKDRSFGDQAHALGQELGFRQFQYGQNSSDYRADMRAKAMADAQAARDAAADRRAGERADAADVKLEGQSLNERIKRGEEQLRAAEQLANTYVNFESESSKDRKGTEKKIGELAGKANIDPSTFQQVKLDSETGIKIPFIDTEIPILKSEDPKKKADALNARVIKPMREELNKLRERRRQLSVRRPTAEGDSDTGAGMNVGATGGTEGGDTSDERVAVRDRDGRSFSLPRNQLAEAQKRGYTVIDASAAAPTPAATTTPTPAPVEESLPDTSGNPSPDPGPMVLIRDQKTGEKRIMRESNPMLKTYRARQDRFTIQPIGPR